MGAAIILILAGYGVMRATRDPAAIATGAAIALFGAWIGGAALWGAQF